MKLHQISLFLENRPGAINPPCKCLADANVNIQTLTLADTEEFGILRLIVDDWQKGRAVLEDAGYATTVTDVLAIPMDDHPGGFVEVMSMIEDCGVNIEYLYAFTAKCDNQAVLIFRFEDNDKALQLLKEKGINTLSNVVVDER